MDPNLVQPAKKGRLSGIGGATRVLMTISLMKDLCVLKQWNGYKMFGGLSFSL